MQTTTHEQKVQNILAWFGNATEEERITGLRWYEAAHKLAASLAHRYEYTVETAAAVIAVTSPQKAWSVNMAIATLALSDGKVVFNDQGKVENLALTTVNGVKVQRLLDGERPVNVLGGPKVNSFFRNIMSNGEDDGVTVDRHAVNIAEYREVGDRERIALLKVTKSRDGYGEYSDAYREVAYRLSLSVAKVQATTWIARRNTLEGRSR